MEVIVKYNGDIDRVAELIGGSAEKLSDRYAVITADRESLDELYRFTEIEDIESAKRVYFETNFNLSSSCINTVQKKNSFGLLGRGVIAAIIDSGIDYTHPDFRNEDGTSRIISLWDQTIDGAPPDGFNEGSEYTNNMINLALAESDPFELVPSRDFLGHGTAVAGIAAGNGSASDGENIGVAPLCDLIVVKVGQKGNDFFAQTTEIMRAVRYVIDKSRELARPAAVNLSFGMNNGAHDGGSLFEEFLTDVSNEWKCVIVAPTGNEGSAGHHYSGRAVQGEVKNIEFFTASGIEGFYLSLWKNFADRFSVELIFPGGMSSGVIDIENQIKTVRYGNIVLTVLYGQPTRYSADQEIFFDIRADSGTVNAGAWVLRIIPVEIVDGRFDIWLPTLEEVSARTYFSGADIYGTMTIPASAKKIVRVAGYNDRIGSIAPFSGLGRKDNTEIPDIAAPAVNILTARSGGGYDSFTGTSFAAPFVTGSAVLMMEWGIINGNSPFFYGERIRAFLRLGAKRSAGAVYPNPQFGYGRLCLSASLRYMSDYTFGQNYFLI